MFELATLTPAKLASVNCRAEMHGAESVPAVDLKFSFDAANTILSEFDGWLLTSLYMRRDATDKDSGQAVLDGVEPVSDVPNLRMPGLGMPLKWDIDLTGYHLRLEYGIGGRSNVELDDCKCNTFTIEAKEGGTVTVGVRVQATSGLTEKILGKLATLVQHDVQIALMPPDEGRQQELESGPAAKGGPDEEPPDDDGPVEALKRAVDSEKTQLSDTPAWPFPGTEAAKAMKGAAPKLTTKDVTGRTGKQPAKYRDAATGETWSGRGIMPKWLKVALDKRDKKLTDFEVAAAH